MRKPFSSNAVGKRGFFPFLASDGESRREEMSMARRLITALLAHAVLKTNEGYLHVSNTLGVVDILIKRGVLADESDLAQELLSDLLAVILPPKLVTNTTSGPRFKTSNRRRVDIIWLNC